MARFQVTAAAVERLRKLLDDLTAEPMVVVLYWTGAQAELIRRADGGAEWVRSSDGRWCVALDPRKRYTSTSPPIEVIGDLEFVVKEIPQQQSESIYGRTLDYVNGEFNVS